MELSEELKAKLETVSSVEEAVEILKENGIEITAAEIEAAMNEPEGELDETALDDVAGGVNLKMVALKIGNAVGKLVGTVAHTVKYK